MKLFELKIKKPHISDGLFIRYVAKKFLENGFHIIGKGISAFVFTKDHLDHVYKIYNYDDAYYEFARYCIENPSKHLPKLKLINLSNSNFGIVKIEKLRNVNRSIKISNFIYELTKYNYLNSSELPKELENSSYKEEHLFLLKLVKQFPYFKTDIHAGNIMVRDNGDLVFTDIFVDIENKNKIVNQAISHVKDLFNKDDKTKNEFNALVNISNETQPRNIDFNNIHHNDMSGKFVNQFFDKFGYITSDMYLKTLKNYKIKEDNAIIRDITTNTLPEIESERLKIQYCKIKKVDLKNINDISMNSLNEINEIRISNSKHVNITDDKNIQNLICFNVKNIELFNNRIENMSISSNNTIIRRTNIQHIVVETCDNLLIYYESKINILQLNSKISKLEIEDSTISKIIITKNLRKEYGDILNDYEDIIEYI